MRLSVATRFARHASSPHSSVSAPSWISFASRLARPLGARIPSSMDNIFRVLGSPDNVARTQKAYICEGLMGFIIGFLMMPPIHRQKKGMAVVTFMLPVVAMLIRSLLVAWEHTANMSRSRFSTDAHRADLVSWIYPTSSLVLVVWFAIEACFKLQDVPVLLVVGFAFLIFMNVFLGCLSLAALISSRALLRARQSRIESPPQPELCKRLDIRLERWTQHMFEITELRGPETQQCPMCTICLGEFKIGDFAKRLACGHVFHGRCVDTWLSQNVTRGCPLRCTLPTPSRCGLQAEASALGEGASPAPPDVQRESSLSARIAASPPNALAPRGPVSSV